MNGVSLERSLSVIVVDDHPLILEGIVNVVNGLERFSLIGKASDGKKGLELCREKTPDIVIADIDMPILNGVEMALAIKEEYDWMKVVFLTSHVNLDTFRKAINIDFSGFIFKENALEELGKCLEDISKGKRYLGSGYEDFVKNNQFEIDNYNKIDVVLNGLTKSELKVLRLISEGKTTTQIAEDLFNSVKTIENHRYNICRKLGVDGSNALLCFAIENRLYLAE